MSAIRLQIEAALFLLYFSLSRLPFFARITRTAQCLHLRLTLCAQFSALALMSELQSARIASTGGSVVVNGRGLPLADAATIAENVHTVQALDSRVTIEVTRIVEENWRDFHDAVGVRAALRKDGCITTRFRPADDLELVVTLLKGYRTGDLLWICLPDSLSCLHGGGQVKQFAVDFEGNDTVRVPLVVTGKTTNAQGRPAPHRFAICVRNMYEEERIGNPRPIELLRAT